MSNDKDVDAVGACVGMKGMRVQSIIRELRGEKIDIIEYSRRCRHLRRKSAAAGQGQPRHHSRHRRKTSRSLVDDTQLSLAIGKKGQNVRLAAKLLGWKIDIKSEEEKRQEVEQEMSRLVGSSSTPLENVPGLGEGVVEKLTAAGVTTVEALADMTPEQLEAIEGIGPKTVEKISLAVNNYFASLEGGEAVPAEGEAVEEAPAEEAASEGQELLAEEVVSDEGMPVEAAEPGPAGEESVQAASDETAEVAVAEEPGEEQAPAEAKEE